SLEAHADLERLGKTIAGLDAKELRVVFAEGILRIEGDAHFLADRLALERGFDLGKDAPETVEVGDLVAVVVEGGAVAVADLVGEGDYLPPVNLHDRWIGSGRP